ncbi:MAG: hybrid sensor histidine kinase/response regulator transcription factor, partial [Cyclobacteriaceae bacterium]
QVAVQGSYRDLSLWKTPLANAISYLDRLELTYRQNDFSLEFAALNFVNPESNLYKYKLEPYEEDWIETSASNRIARYTNISPGEYTFRVTGSNNDGLWNEAGKSLSIIVLPPWWQTWWAYALYALVFIGVFLYWRSYEIKRVKLKHRAEYLSELDQLKSRFFANISHEFRNPLTLILGPVKKLIDKQTNQHDQNNLAGIQRNAQRLLRLVNQLLDLSKLEAGKLKLEAVKSDIVSFVRNQANAFSSLADSKNISFTIDLPEEKVGVYFDRDKLEKIINNLLSNAFKFTPEEGSVKVKMQPITKGTKEWMQIKVADSGKGIPPKEIKKIFDRFYQVDASLTREQEGTGIGLALTKELVELHHGEIKVKSVRGQVTTFTLLLPLGKDHLNEEDIIQELPLPEEAIESVEARMHPSELVAHTSDTLLEKDSEQVVEKPLVLIVEDHQEMRKFIRTSIGDQYQVQEAEHGVVGLEMSQELLPDLIISDVMMPEMDGYALCEKIKTDELTSHIPVVLLTAKADRRSKLTGLQTGADDYLSKPFDEEELQLIVRNRIAERRKMRERFSRDITLEPRHISITSLDEQFLAKVLDIIEEHMADENFSIEALSQQAGYSHMHFYRKIKALSGQTPSQFLRTIRLKRAAAMLQKKSDQVTQIAYNVGFNSLSYFNKCFKDQFGMTPGQYAAAAPTVK